jgi:hypothetical protein
MLSAGYGVGVDRRRTVIMYACAIGLVGAYLWLQSPRGRDAVLGVVRRLRDCQGCKRRREAVQRVIHEAERAVGWQTSDE